MCKFSFFQLLASCWRSVPVQMFKCLYYQLSFRHGYILLSMLFFFLRHILLTYSLRCVFTYTWVTCSSMLSVHPSSSMLLLSVIKLFFLHIFTHSYWFLRYGHFGLARVVSEGGALALAHEVENTWERQRKGSLRGPPLKRLWNWRSWYIIRVWMPLSIYIYTYTLYI